MTVLPNIWTKRRYESQAKRSSPDCLAKPSTESSFRPTSKTVSIIPGIENLAPLRTDTSKGSLGSPKVLPISRSRRAKCSLTSSRRPGGRTPVARKCRQASVVIVKPGGTGKPRFDISARLAPLPPSRSNIVLLPSAKS